MKGHVKLGAVNIGVEERVFDGVKPQLPTISNTYNISSPQLL